jgi:hypothetical protein
MFIEMMYQQLFTEDGQLRSEMEPTVLANCVKQIVTQSRRNSMARRDSVSSNIHYSKLSSAPFHHSMASRPTPFSSPSRFKRGTFSEEEERHTLQRNRTATLSSR